MLFYCSVSSYYVTQILFATFQPSVEITCLWRSQSSLAEFGVNHLARWKPDNSKLAVTVRYFLCHLCHENYCLVVLHLSFIIRVLIKVYLVCFTFIVSSFHIMYIMVFMMRQLLSKPRALCVVRSLPLVEEHTVAENHKMPIHEIIFRIKNYVHYLRVACHKGILYTGREAQAGGKRKQCAFRLC